MPPRHRRFIRLVAANRLVAATCLVSSLAPWPACLALPPATAQGGATSEKVSYENAMAGSVQAPAARPAATAENSAGPGAQPGGVQAQQPAQPGYYVPQNPYGQAASPPEPAPTRQSPQQPALYTQPAPYVQPNPYAQPPLHGQTAPYAQRAPYGQATQSLPGTAPGDAQALQPLSAALVLSQNYAYFKANPTPDAFTPLLSAIEVYLSQPGMEKNHAAQVVRSNQALMDLGVKAYDSGNVKVFTFPKVTFSHTALVYYADVKTQITMVGRRHHIKRVTHTTVWRHDRLRLPNDVILKDARMAAAPDSPHVLVLVGDQASNLWLRAYDSAAGSLHENQQFFASIPTFLTIGVSGKVAFRGSDLIFMVARTAHASSAAGNGLLPECDSSTYRFLLKMSPGGYVLDQHLPDEDRYLTVYQFLQNIATGNTDLARLILTDEKLISIPKYLGLTGRPSLGPFKVVEMAAPAAGVSRFRLVTFQKSDLIFDVTRGKDRTDPARMRERNLIRAIFIAPQDPYLLEIARTLPTYERSLEPPAAKPGVEPAG